MVTRCRGLTARRRPCRNRARADGYCHVHGVASADELLRAVTAAARGGSWRAAAWLLERQHPALVRPNGDAGESGSDFLDELARKRDERRSGS